MGEGAFGIVYSAHELQTNKEIAIKEVKLDNSNEHSRMKVKKEGIILSKLKNVSFQITKQIGINSITKTIFSLQQPHIIALKSCEFYSDCIYLFMEYMDGGDLEKYLSAQSLTVPNAKLIFYQICIGVQYLHDNNVVHR